MQDACFDTCVLFLFFLYYLKTKPEGHKIKMMYYHDKAPGLAGGGRFKAARKRYFWKYCFCLPA